MEDYKQPLQISILTTNKGNLYYLTGIPYEDRNGLNGKFKFDPLIMLCDLHAMHTNLREYKPLIIKRKDVVFVGSVTSLKEYSQDKLERICKRGMYKGQPIYRVAN